MGPPSRPNPRPIVLAPKENYNKNNNICFINNLNYNNIFGRIIIFRNSRIFLTQIIIFFSRIFGIIIKQLNFIAQIIIFRNPKIFLTQLIIFLR
jgi:hypothetical protein